MKSQKIFLHNYGVFLGGNVNVIGKIDLFVFVNKNYYSSVFNLDLLC